MSYRLIFYLLFFPLTIIFFKWFLIFSEFKDFEKLFTIFINFSDKAYLPFVISLSNLNFSPTYNDYFTSNGVMTFPYASIFIHSILFKFFDLNAYIVSEYIFVFLGYFIIFKFIKNSGIKKVSSIITTLIIFSSPIILEYINVFFYSDFLLHIKDQIFSYHLQSQRFPRPLVTNIFFYAALCFLISLNKDKTNKRNTYVFLSILCALLLQSFIYYFLLIFLTILVILTCKIIQIKEFIAKNYFNILYSIFIFLIFSLPFILQNFFATEGYSSRMGLMKLDFESRKILFLQTFYHFFKIKYLFSAILIFSFYFFFKKKFNKNFLNSYQVYLILFLLSFILPFLFLLFSPYVIWFKHFFDTKNLVFLIGFILIISFFVNNIENLFNKKSYFYFIFLYFFLIFFNLNYLYNKIPKQISKNINYYNDLYEVILSSEKKIKNKNYFNIFSNSSFLNSYYIYKNQNIIYPNYFHVALSDKDLEKLMFNSLKYLEYTPKDFEEYLKNDLSSWRSSNNISVISGHKYQFNFYYTYFNLDSYGKNEINFLNSSGLFLASSVALSENKIQDLKNKFILHDPIKNLIPHLIIIDKNEKLKIRNLSNYSKLVENKNFKLLVIN